MRRPQVPERTLDELRPLLVGPEQHRIRRIEEQLNHHMPELVASVLPEAVTISRKSGVALGWAAAPVVETCVRDLVHRDPDTFAAAITPAIGPAIRKAVAAALRALLEALDAALGRSLSVRSLGWRIEALRTGRPFAEVVLCRTLLYRVEQLFLIHRNTGLLLEHLVAEDAVVKDPAQVSAMLSAIESFVHEAFREDARLERFRVGELACWVEHGPEAILVAVVRGAAPEDYEASLSRTLERIHLEFGEELAGFRGDPAPFARGREVLLDCLQERRRTARRRLWLPPALLIAILTPLAILLMRGFRREHARFMAYEDALRHEPGLMLTVAESRPKGYFFAGLRDPLAPDPKAVLSAHGLDPQRATIAFQPFYSLDPAIVARRALAILRPPPGVSAALQGGTLEVRGVAPDRFIDHAARVAATLPGVEGLSDGHLYSEEAIATVKALKATIDHTELLFDIQEAKLDAREATALDKLAAEVRNLLARSPKAGMTVHIDVTGYADPTGTTSLNANIARARAEYVAEELRARGVPTDAITTHGGGIRWAEFGPGCEHGERFPECRIDKRRARSVTLEALLQKAEDP